MDRHVGIATPESQEKMGRGQPRAGCESEPEVVEFTVYDRKDFAPVGTAGLLGVLHAHGNAEYAIVLGERRGARISHGQPTDIVLMDAVPQDFGVSLLR
jgi:hypothetical protein